ncbi:radical SAM protein [Candidatus Woesearchaeota archaeon]|nr:radical SAM protein [Candidatus Woesearchaeota archaeon]
MAYTILDCYTDEAAGLGVPPYLGTYPRYIAGYLNEPVSYITIDDLRLWSKYGSKSKGPKPSEKTDIFVYNLTKNSGKIGKILEDTDELIIVLGVHVPGKYLSAVPGTIKELIPLIKGIPCKKTLTGPAVFGTQLFGGKFFEKYDKAVFDKIDANLFRFNYGDVREYAVKGAEIFRQIPDLRMIEIETGRGCDIGHCSFCTEPIKSRVEFREKDDILREMEAFYQLGARYFRYGKQTCFYTYPKVIELLRETRDYCPELKVLHIDNVNPVKVVMDRTHEITKSIVKYCTSGNIAAFGVESFDREVVRQNTLNSTPKIAYEGIKIINKYGAERGEDGLPRFLPGINIIFGLLGETKKTNDENMQWLKKIYDDGMMLRRINIRQAAIFEGTMLYEKSKSVYLAKQKKLYWKWRNEIRQKIDFPMLQRVAPNSIILRNCYAEIYDGNTTFCRQFGTYPLIVGVKGRLELKKFYNLEITGHMLRSITGKVAVKKELLG